MAYLVTACSLQPPADRMDKEEKVTTYGRPPTTGKDRGIQMSRVNQLRVGVRLANAAHHHHAMRVLLNEIKPEPIRCPQCGQEKKITLSLVDPELELLNGRYYLGYTWQGRDRGGKARKELRPYALSVSVWDYNWLCGRCNIAEGQPSMRHNIMHILAANNRWSEPPENSKIAYKAWYALTGGPFERIGRLA